ncbi:Immunoglobulin E-set [Pseudocohnilembus persalinus]|uniref:Immunoglobulin E-set n=1 Tax=Pseudocohnilembus persalinus TaxID=266149 RepID=A0A0V0QJC5_PSEPJ|nr:Immunoglobulin E-set [Pseudocohnilembus persalinus]|eukprot:KRX02064.1 Immunoglobulin E-set [Pseudocohnilembus persalinus]
MGFQDSFTNQEGSESNLQYDDTAFRYFFLSILAAIIVPLLFSIIKPFVKNPTKSKLQDAYPNNKSIKKFDPWEILNIEPNSDITVIKQAFRKMSRMYHPDVAKDDPEATAKFIMVQKAHECLTDETKRDICAKYGSPDGPGKMNVAIAMPSFLLDKNNHVIILFVFFLILLVILPTVVYMWYKNYNLFDEYGTLKSNYKIFYQGLNENVLIKNLIQILSLCREFKNITINKQQSEDLTKIMKSLDDEFKIPPTLPKEVAPVYILICAHIQRIKVPKTLEKKYDYIIVKCPQLLQSMIALIMSHPLFNRRLPTMQKNQKFFGVEPIKKIISLQQMIVQGMTNKTPDIFQLSYFNQNPSDIRNKKVATIKELIQQSSENRKLNFISDEKEKEEVNKEIDIFPHLEVSHFAGVEGENQITEQDVPKVQVTIKTKNLKKNQIKPLVHAPYFPSFKNEKWHFIIASEKGDVLHYQLIKPEKEIAEESFITRMPLGKFKFHLYVRPDCYLGFDYEDTVTLEIVHSSTVERKIEWHEEDKQLDKQVSLMESMLKQI